MLNYLISIPFANAGWCKCLKGCNTQYKQMFYRGLYKSIREKSRHVLSSAILSKARKILQIKLTFRPEKTSRCKFVIVRILLTALEANNILLERIGSRFYRPLVFEATEGEHNNQSANQLPLIQ